MSRLPLPDQNLFRDFPLGLTQRTQATVAESTLVATLNRPKKAKSKLHAVSKALTDSLTDLSVGMADVLRIAKNPEINHEGDANTQSKDVYAYFVIGPKKYAFNFRNHYEYDYGDDEAEGDCNFCSWEDDSLEFGQDDAKKIYT